MAKGPSQLECLSDQLHKLWMGWAKAVQGEVSPVRAKRWKKLFVAYDKLPEVEKDKDRKLARRVQKVVKLGAEQPGDVSMQKDSFARELGRALAKTALDRPRRRMDPGDPTCLEDPEAARKRRAQAAVHRAARAAAREERQQSSPLNQKSEAREARRTKLRE